MQPFFSVVVPTYNRPDQLARCLQALARLHYARECYEAIIVDDGSSVSLEHVVVRFHDQLNIVLLRQAHAGPAAARNFGAMHAKGEFLAFTDDDCMPRADWLQNLRMRFAEMSDCAIGGQALNGLTDNAYAEASQLLIAYFNIYYNADLEQAYFFASNNLAVSAHLFRTSGGFDVTFQRAAAEDRDLCDRWLYRGYRIIYAPEVVVYHSHALTLRTFWKQHFNYGRGGFRFHQLRAKRRQGQLGLEPLRFYLDLVGYVFSQTSHNRRLLMTILSVVSQGVNAIGFWWEWVLNRARRVTKDQ